MKFEDHFSRQAGYYARYRPQYPSELFSFLASLVSSHERVWDCATGNGQAALGLVPYFRRIVATDASDQQIEHATHHEKITYRVAHAEDSGLEDHSIDLITVATALHWFDLDAFYAEVRRVAKPGSVLAAWSYGSSDITPEINAVLGLYTHEIVGSYWSPRIRLVDEHYRTIPFPFEEIAAPTLSGEARWTLEEMMGYLNSWSATQSFLREHGYNPIETVRQRFEEAWGEPEEPRTVRWNLYFRIGRVQPAML